MAYTPPAKGYAPGGVTYNILHALKQKTAAKPAKTAKTQPSEAELAVRAQLAPLYAALDAQETSRQKQEDDAQRYAQQQTLAYMQSLQAQAPQQLADYQNAAGQTASLAGRAADLLKSSSPDSQIQAGLQAIGAPVAQQQQIAGQDQANFGGAGASLFTSMGSVPGASLEAQGLAAANLLRGLSGSVAAAGQQNLAARQTDSAAARAKYQADRAGITARTPELLQAYNAAAAGNYYKQAQIDLERQSLGLTARKTDAALTGIDPVTGQPLPTKPDPALSRLRGVIVDSNNQIIPDANGNQIPVYHPPKTGVTPAQKAAAAAAKNRKTALANRATAKTKGLNEANTLAKQSNAPKYVTVTKQVPQIVGNVQVGTKTVKVKQRVQRESYQTVHSRAVALPDVQILKTRYGYSDAQINDLVDEQLAAYGYRRPRYNKKAG